MSRAVILDKRPVLCAHAAGASLERHAALRAGGWAARLGNGRDSIAF